MENKNISETRSKSDTTEYIKQEMRNESSKQEERRGE
jgi:hypothetical protein